MHVSSTTLGVHITVNLLVFSFSESSILANNQPWSSSININIWPRKRNGWRRTVNGPGIGNAGGLMWQRGNGLLVGAVFLLLFSFLVSFGDCLVVWVRWGPAGLMDWSLVHLSSSWRLLVSDLLFIFPFFIMFILTNIWWFVLLRENGDAWSCRFLSVSSHVTNESKRPD